MLSATTLNYTIVDGTMYIHVVYVIHVVHVAPVVYICGTCTYTNRMSVAAQIPRTLTHSVH